MLASTPFKTRRHLEETGIRITASPGGFKIQAADQWDYTPLVIEVYRAGLLVKSATLTTDTMGDFLGDINPAECGIRILDTTGFVLASMEVEIDRFPFMRPNGEQKHITENYVAVPPALTITDELGAIWTLGMITAPEHKAPAGEFAFAVLRNGIDTGEVASRIERRNGRIKIFTCKGWKSWTGSNFF